MPQVAEAVRKERAARLRAAGERALGRLPARQVGRVERVLIERGGAGRTEQFAPFRIPKARAPPAGRRDRRAARVDGVARAALLAAPGMPT